MQCGPMPTAQFASISILMDDSEIDIDSLVQLTTVFSPLSEMTPMAVKNALGELHSKIQKISRLKTRVDLMMDKMAMRRLRPNRPDMTSFKMRYTKTWEINSL